MADDVAAKRASGASAREITAATTVVGVMGDPITHSLSPSIHNSAFEALSLDWVCVAFPTPASEAVAAVRGMVALGIVGMSVTMPNKEAVIEALDVLSDDAGQLHAVNCIVPRDGRTNGLNTDGDGLVAGLRNDFGATPEGIRCAVIGAGGSSRSVILALARSGATEVGVINRTSDKAHAAAQLADVATVANAAFISECDLVINATSLGMVDTAATPCEPDILRRGQLVVDRIYSPAQTRWLAEAKQREASTANGLAMLVDQAAVAFREWTGHEAPVDVMTAAVQSRLAKE